jgi:hypothetical protein
VIAIECKIVSHHPVVAGCWLLAAVADCCWWLICCRVGGDGCFSTPNLFFAVFCPKNACQALKPPNPLKPKQIELAR